MDALYIGGGFPETNAIELCRNTGFMRTLKSAIEIGLPVYAECGGLMFLGRSIIYNNKSYPMVNALPIDFMMESKPQAHGYTVVNVIGDNPYYSKNTEISGHEFHYSKVININKDSLNFVFKMKRGKGIIDHLDGIVYKNVLATYTHTHALGCEQWGLGMVESARKYIKKLGV
ncbi:cobyrinic acid A,C-diamide synthase [Candidatus Magnetoovum chiemensis]|nr:cobyrinic acid A,C-diamide synthase [Candidatus Magnetoovum chiemensis]